MISRLKVVAAKFLASFKRFEEKLTVLAENSSLNRNHAARDAHFYVRVGWRVLIIGLGGFLLWAVLAPLDRGVTASGWVIADGQRKVIQHLNGGWVEEILVKEGDQVVAGQTLVKLNKANAEAALAITTETVNGLELQIASLQASIDQRKAQLATQSVQLSNIETLSKEGFVPKNRVLEMQQQQSLLRAAIASDTANLAGLKKELASNTSRVNPAETDLSNTELKAPVDGYVVNLQVHTKGGIVMPSTKILEIVPTNLPLIVEAQLPVYLIDKVYEGLEVEMLFTAFNQNRTPHIPGVITVVGDDRIVDERTGQPYFKVLAEATPEGKKLLGDHKVRPGMPVDLFVKTGERTMASYLLKPLLDRMHSALREE